MQLPIIPSKTNEILPNIIVSHIQNKHLNFAVNKLELCLRISLSQFSYETKYPKQLSFVTYLIILNYLTIYVIFDSPFWAKKCNERSFLGSILIVIFTRIGVENKKNMISIPHCSGMRGNGKEKNERICKEKIQVFNVFRVFIDCFQTLKLEKAWSKF